MVYELIAYLSSVEYTWSDQTTKKARLPASQYIDYMTSSIESMLNDESLFPTKSGKVLKEKKNRDFSDSVK